MDPAPDPRVLDLGVVDGSPEALRGDTMIIGREYAAMLTVRLGESYPTTLPDGLLAAGAALRTR